MKSLDNVEVLELFGKVNASNSDAIRSVVKDALKHGARSVLVDCKDMISIDASGLSSLIIALKLARSAGGRLCLCSVNDSLKMMLQLTGLDKVFEIFSSRFEFEQSLT